VRNKRSPTKIIESTSPKVEGSFVKYSGEELEDWTSDYSTETRTSFMKPTDSDVKYTSIHTHPTAFEEKRKTNRTLVEKISNIFLPGLFPKYEGTGTYKEINYSATPSGKDLESFLTTEKMETMMIAVREPQTGKVLGYTIIKKTKQTPKLGLLTLANMDDDITSYTLRRQTNILNNALPALKTIAHRYSLKYRFVPVKGYTINDSKTQYIKKITPAIIGIISLGASTIFLGKEITGNVIGNISHNTPNLTGIILFTIGIIGILTYIRNNQ